LFRQRTFKPSIGFYIRPLRSIYNYALADPNSELSKKFILKIKIHYSNWAKHKKSFINIQLKAFFEIEPENEFQKARALWF
jgi:molybdopterin-guanine dinucleotide biosynthesis protein A